MLHKVPGRTNPPKKMKKLIFVCFFRIFLNAAYTLYTKSESLFCSHMDGCSSHTVFYPTSWLRIHSYLVSGFAPSLATCVGVKYKCVRSFGSVEEPPVTWHFSMSSQRDVYELVEPRPFEAKKNAGLIAKVRTRFVIGIEAALFYAFKKGSLQILGAFSPSRF